MAAEDREHDADIIEKLTTKSSRFSFVQAVRLLVHHLDNSSLPGDPGPVELLERYIRVRPELSLRFPGTDITDIEKTGHDPEKYRITATFLGLYGSYSPLPTFYTEDLIDEMNEDGSIKRDFIDIINFTLYPLFFRIWSKHRLFYKICEERDDTVTNMIYCFLGLENDHLRRQIHNIEKYFRYTGLALQFPRSAEGLESMIEDCFDLKGQVNVRQCVMRTVSIHEDQHSLIGISSCSLGLDAVIGKHVKDISGKFQVIVSNGDADILHAFLPNQVLFTELKQMVAFYVNQPLEWDLIIEFEEEKVKTAQPGNTRWSHLGWNTWLFSENRKIEQTSTCFQ